MDPLENNLHELYQEKKKLDEKFIPPFDAFWDEARRAAKLKKRLRFLRIATSVAAITILITGLIFYFKDLNRQSEKAIEVSGIGLDQTLPSQELLNKNLTITYIWQWKSSTDKLLDDAKRSIKQEN